MTLPGETTPRPAPPRRGMGRGWYYANMRTSVDLPADLMQAAKVKAAQRGESLKDLFTRAVAHEVGAPSRARTGGRITLPLIGQSEGPRVDVTNADIEAVLDADDIERYGR